MCGRVMTCFSEVHCTEKCPTNDMIQVTFQNIVQWVTFGILDTSVCSLPSSLSSSMSSSSLSPHFHCCPPPPNQVGHSEHFYKMKDSFMPSFSPGPMEQVCLCIINHGCILSESCMSVVRSTRFLIILFQMAD